MYNPSTTCKVFTYSNNFANEKEWQKPCLVNCLCSCNQRKNETVIDIDLWLLVILLLYLKALDQSEIFTKKNVFQHVHEFQTAKLKDETVMDNDLRFLSDNTFNFTISFFTKNNFAVVWVIFQK